MQLNPKRKTVCTKQTLIQINRLHKKRCPNLCEETRRHCTIPLDARPYV